MTNKSEDLFSKLLTDKEKEEEQKRIKEDEQKKVKKEIEEIQELYNETSDETSTISKREIDKIIKNPKLEYDEKVNKSIIEKWNKVSQKIQNFIKEKENNIELSQLSKLYTQLGSTYENKERHWITAKKEKFGVIDLQIPETENSLEAIKCYIKAFEFNPCDNTFEILNSFAVLLNKHTVLSAYLNKSLKDIPYFVGSSKATLILKEEIERVIGVNTPVLIIGESGVGKKLVAKIIHKKDRPNTPFIEVNCASEPEGTFESNFFGYKKGAFTDAKEDHAGYFIQADNGIIFLDEFTELKPELQAKLLTVLQERKVMPLGGKQIEINCRVISATNKTKDEINKMMVDGKLRKDFYFRINNNVICVPSLRKRKKDIPQLVKFLEIKNLDHIKKPTIITKEAVKILQQYDWKDNNVRELEQVVQKALSRGKEKGIDEKTILAILEEIGSKIEFLKIDKRKKGERPTKEELIEMLKKYKLLREVASHYQVTRQTIFNWRKIHNTSP